MAEVGDKKRIEKDINEIICYNCDKKRHYLEVSEAKKLVLVPATFMSMTGARKEALVLEYILYIHYPVQFKKDVNKTQIQALINSGNKFNTIHPTFVKELGLPIKPTEFEVQKIDGTMLDIYEIIVAVFLVMDKANQVRFFKEILLVANVSLEVVFRMLFLTLNSADIDFLDWELRWRIYTIEEALPTTRHIKLVRKI